MRSNTNFSHWTSLPTCEILPSPCVCIVLFILVGQTEIVENSSNPLFMKTIGLGNQGTPPRTKIKLCVYDVRELVSRTVSQTRCCVFLIKYDQTVHTSSKKSFRLHSQVSICD